MVKTLKVCIQVIAAMMVSSLSLSFSRVPHDGFCEGFHPPLLEGTGQGLETYSDVASS